MAARRVQRFGIDRRLVELERRVVRCAACAAATSSFFRVLEDDDFEGVVTTGVYRDICAACGHERPGAVKIYRRSDIAGI